MLLEPELTDLPLAQTAPPDRRAVPRYRCRLANPVRAWAPGGSAARLAWMCNASETGAGLILEWEAIAGHPLEFRLLTAAGARVAFRGQVVHVTSQADGRWLVGCTFNERLAQCELEALL